MSQSVAHSALLGTITSSEVRVVTPEDIFIYGIDKRFSAETPSIEQCARWAFEWNDDHADLGSHFAVVVDNAAHEPHFTEHGFRYSMWLLPKGTAV